MTHDPKCKGEFKPSKVLANIWWWNRGGIAGTKAPRGVTLNPGPAHLFDCMKCSICGHSVVEAPADLIAPRG